MNFARRIFLVVFLTVICSPVFSDDGMWMPHQMKMLNLEEIGLEMDGSDLYKKDGTGLMSAVVNLGGGTGEFVSRDGLILTNHHVAFGAIQRASDSNNDYIQEGFLAFERKEEIAASGYIADVLLGYKEITGKIQSALNQEMNYREKYDALDKIRKEIIRKAEEQGSDIRCRIASMYSGNKYYLFTFKRIKDIRLVYAPPQDLGNFGGDVDNWMWPRHTCDFSFLRAYVSKDNKGADYSPENVPYHPKSVITISLKGVKEGDFTFVMGYPGRTYRNYTLSEILSDIDRMKESIKTRKNLIRFYEEAGKNNKDIEIKYAGKIKGMNNGLKNYQGKLEGMKKSGLIDRKKEYEIDFKKWILRSSEYKKKYKNCLEDIRLFTESSAKTNKKRSYLSELLSSYYGSTILSQAHLIVRTVTEREKPDIERESAYQDRNFNRLKMRVKLAERGYDPAVDRKFMKYRLKQFMDLPEELIPSPLQDIVGSKSDKAVHDFVDDIYEQTRLTDPEERLALMNKTLQEIEALKDPFIELALKFEEELKIIREQGKAKGQERNELKKKYLEALLEKSQGKMAADANGSIRFTCGTVEGYVPRDAMYYKPLTSLTGVIEKKTDSKPFRVPEKLMTLYRNKEFGGYIDKNLNDIPVCFLNTTNVTGGSSGSPTLNAKGEQVGIIFDMTYESVIGDYYIIPEFQRTISVDIRYVLFITEKFSGADFLIREMGL